MELYQELIEKGLSHIRKGENVLDPQVPWKDSLSEKLHHFAGNYHKNPGIDHHRLDIVEGQLLLKMAPPTRETSSIPDYFTDEQYCKHLLGMTYSVPVMEVLLKPLQDIFKTKEYQNYNYSYSWQVTKHKENKKETK